MMKKQGGITEFPAPLRMECPSCGSESVRTRIESQRFIYGEGASAAELTALVPVRQCLDCEFEFTDGEAEDARHEAVCRHLGVFTPREIVAVRKRYQMSRTEFAELTRLGEASLGRWESGQLIQNPGNDQLLYLLTVPSNIEMLRQRASKRAAAREARAGAGEIRKRFAALADIDSYARQAAGFQLCPAMQPGN
jgi:DNA-binding transcriptional regulator YiaG